MITSLLRIRGWSTAAICAVSIAIPSSSPIFAAGNPIGLRSRSPDRGVIPRATQPPRLGQRSGLQLIQFTDTIQPSWRQELEARGVKLIRYVPQNAFVVRLSGVEPAELESLDYVAWTGSMRPDDKLLPGLEVSEDEPIRLLVAPDVDDRGLGQVRRLLKQLDRESSSRFGVVLEGLALPGNVQALAASEFVLWIEPGPQMRLLGEIGSKVVGGDDGNTNTPTMTQAVGLDGSGVTVAVVDTGLGFGEESFMHPDLAGRVRGFLAYGGLSNAADEHGHGTHVAGILSGSAVMGETDGRGFLHGLGVAPGASLVVQRIFDELGAYHPPSSFARLVQDARDAGADLGSNSWGEGTHGRYDLSAMEFDALVRDADAGLSGDQPYTLVFSAGNAGPASQTIYSPAVAKNVIAAGASQNNLPTSFFYAEGPDAMADFSSRGPCEDGRLKPDLVAPGTWIASARSPLAPDDSFWGGISPSYAYMGGTSQSAPHVSGAAAAFIQYHRDRTGGLTPSPALIKAALINSAADLDASAGTPSAPNNDEGWGRLDLKQLLLSTRRYDFRDQSVLLQTGESYEQRVVITSSEQPLKVTLAYTDVPAFPGAIPALVNDLDLVVVGPDGSRYGGNQFLGGQSLPNRPLADRINNVEGVHLATPIRGEYLIRVTAHNVVEDARNDTTAIDQDYALVASGALAEPGEIVIYFDHEAYSAPSLMQLRLVNMGAAGIPSLSVQVTSTTEPEGESLELIADSAGTTFTNAMSISTEAPGLDGELQVTHGDLLQARFSPTDPPMAVEATAMADLRAPVISDVTVTNQFGAARISWNTDEPASGLLYYSVIGQASHVVTNTLTATQQEFVLKNLAVNTLYECVVVATDRAGNASTNDNGGNRFTFLLPQPKTVLLVDAYTPDEMGYGMTDIPVTAYTDALDATDVGYEVWNVRAQGQPRHEDLQPYPVVIWRYNDNPLSSDTLSLPDQEALTAYVEQGGSLFIAGMELLTRIGDVPFRRDVLQVEAFREDAGVPTAEGVPGDIITDLLTLPLDYTVFDSAVLQFLGQTPDVSDTLTLTPDAVPIFQKQGAMAVAGLRYPREDTDLLGRVVYLSFPLAAVSTEAEQPNTRADLLKRVLQFLAPGAEGIASIRLDSPAYTLPSIALCELGDTDLAGQSTVTVQVRSDSAPEGTLLLLNESLRAGVFQGSFSLSSQPTDGAGTHLLAQPGDRIWIEYHDVSMGAPITAEATVDTLAASISSVSVTPGYQSAEVRWVTSEPADSLVQFWESVADLPVNRTVYRQELALNHAITLHGLEPDQLYHFQVVSRDVAGNVTTDSNQDELFSFRTLSPLTLPWTDDLEGDPSGWEVVTVKESETEWMHGPAAGGPTVDAHSPVSVWSSNPGGEIRTFTQTFLISPAIYLSGGSSVTASFWHAYDFSLYPKDLLHEGQLFLVPGSGQSLIPLRTYSGQALDWRLETVDLTPYLGQVIHLAWYYELASFDFRPRPGWCIDDLAVTAGTEDRATLEIRSNLAQASVLLTETLTGFERTGQGVLTVVSNLALGHYTVVFGDVPFYETPSPQQVDLQSIETQELTGLYTFTDANNNSLSDAWELQHFETVDSAHEPTWDTDNDGATDFAEFVSGTDPMNPESYLHTPKPGFRPDGRFQLTWPSVPGRAYRVETSADFDVWTPVSDWINATGTLTLLSLPDDSESGARVFRIQVQP